MLKIEFDSSSPLVQKSGSILPGKSLQKTVELPKQPDQFMRDMKDLLQKSKNKGLSELGTNLEMILKNFISIHYQYIYVFWLNNPKEGTKIMLTKTPPMLIQGNDQKHTDYSKETVYYLPMSDDLHTMTRYVGLLGSAFEMERFSQEKEEIIRNLTKTCFHTFLNPEMMVTDETPKTVLTSEQIPKIIGSFTLSEFYLSIDSFKKTFKDGALEYSADYIAQEKSTTIVLLEMKPEFESYMTKFKENYCFVSEVGEIYGTSCNQMVSELFFPIIEQYKETQKEKLSKEELEEFKESLKSDFVSKYMRFFETNSPSSDRDLYKSLLTTVS